MTLGTLSFKPVCLIHALLVETQDITYISRPFFCLGVAFVGIEPTRDSVSVTTVLNETKGGRCEFLKDPIAGSIPICA